MAKARHRRHRPRYWQHAYTTYIASKEWAEKRARLFKLRGRACEQCASVDDLEVHHKTYERFGDEDDDDLCVLCEECHEKEHARQASMRHIIKEERRARDAWTWTPPVAQRPQREEKPQKKPQAKQETLF